VAIYHRTALSEIIWAANHALCQRALDLIPLVDPWAENDYPPTWWYNYDSASTWRAHLNSRHIPDTWLIETYMRYTGQALGFYIEEIGNWARDTAQNWARAVTGYALYSWSTFSAWIDSIGIRLGSGMVFWGATVIDALNKTYNWLPPEIRTNLQSWGTLLNYWIQKAKDWVVVTYHDLITLGKKAWDWVSYLGDKLYNWWGMSHATLDEFRSNPTGFIVSRLEPTWSWLLWFVNNTGLFYSQLWSWYARDLLAFLADPAGWIWERLEAYVLRLW